MCCHDKPVETFREGENVLEIYQDEVAMDPREWDNVGTMVCWHNRYNLGDKHEFNNPEEFRTYFSKKKNKVLCVLPLYLYDHSGITMSTAPFSCPWDSGQVGWIYTTREQINKLGIKLPRKRETWKQKLQEYLEAEVEVYDQYLTGDVYMFLKYTLETCEHCGTVLHADEDSGGTFYGSKWEENGLFDAANWPPKSAVKETTQITLEQIPA
jgi:hypothetical protein